MIKKQLYAAPATEVLELRLEGVIAGSEVFTPKDEETNEGITWGSGY
jgi:hypothetical protein